jgi:hypothetical protein
MYPISIPFNFSCGVRDKKRIEPLPFFYGCRKKATKILTVLTPDMDYDQTAMSLPTITSAVFLTA